MHGVGGGRYLIVIVLVIVIVIVIVTVTVIVIITTMMIKWLYVGRYLNAAVASKGRFKQCDCDAAIADVMPC